MAELLNKFFASIFTTENQASLSEIKKNMFLWDDNEKLRTFRVSSDVVRMKLNNEIS